MKADYQIWIVSKAGRLVEYAEGAIDGVWTKKTAMREYRAKYRGGTLNAGERYAVVKVTHEVIT